MTCLGRGGSIHAAHGKSGHRTTATSVHAIVVIALRLQFVVQTARAAAPADATPEDGPSWTASASTPSTTYLEMQIPWPSPPVNDASDGPSIMHVAKEGVDGKPQGLAYDIHNILAGVTPGGGMTLLKELHGFVLAGNHEPLLHEINGGKFCVDPAGIQPPGWILHGSSLDLETCAKIASEQKHVVGFKWGSEVYNYSAYMHSVGSEIQGQTAPRTPVQLAQLYRKDTEFQCEVFMVDQWGDVPNISLDNFSYLENTTAVPARRLMPHHMAHHMAAHHAPAHHTAHHAAHHAAHHSMRHVGAAAAFHHGRGGGAIKQEFRVCLQRRALSKFVNKVVPEFWFCYLPKQQWAKCENDMRNDIIQGLAVVVGELVVIIPLSYIMQNQTHFTWGLVWVTRLVTSLQLSVFSIWCLLQLGVNNDVSPSAFSFLAFLIVVVGNSLILLPYECCKAWACCPVFAIVYLLCLVACPVMFLNWAMYISPFIQLVSYEPIPVGLLGFSVEFLKHCLCPHLVERVMGRALSLPQAEDTSSSSFFSTKRQVMVFPKEEQMDSMLGSTRLESSLSRLQFDGDDTDASIADSIGCCSSFWRKRFCCRPDSGRSQFSRYSFDPNRVYYESAEQLPVWSGNGEQAPL